MSNDQIRDRLIAILIRTAQAHHLAMGGVNEEWANWYAERAVDDVNELLDLQLNIEEFAGWLEEADSRYRSEEPGMSWPKAYADWFLTEHV